MMIRVTIAVPIDLIDAANEMAACIGYTEADRRTFGLITHEDTDGNLYSVASGPVMPAFIENAQSPLIEPEWGADMAQADEAQAAVRIWSDEEPVTAAPNIIAAIISEDVDGAISSLGLVRL